MRNIFCYKNLFLIFSVDFLYCGICVSRQWIFIIFQEIHGWIPVKKIEKCKICLWNVVFVFCLYFVYNLRFIFQVQAEISDGSAYFFRLISHLAHNCFCGWVYFEFIPPLLFSLLLSMKKFIPTLVVRLIFEGCKLLNWSMIILVSFVSFN